jgi:DHHC palmitoyltransferase
VEREPLLIHGNKISENLTSSMLIDDNKHITSGENVINPMTVVSQDYTSKSTVVPVIETDSSVPRSAPQTLLPPRAPGSLLQKALANVTSTAIATTGAPEDHEIPQGRVACTSRLCIPFARSLNGNVMTFYRCKRDSRIFPYVCLWGPDWPCNLCTWVLILGPTIPFQALVAWRLHIGVTLAGLVLAFFAISMLAATALSDPGYLPKQSKAGLEAQRLRMEEQGLSGTFTVCQFCNVIRIERTSHCYDCNACVLELDHHCPWMGQCVGKYNLFYFYGFLWAIIILIVFTTVAFFVFIIGRNAPPQ